MPSRFDPARLRTVHLVPLTAYAHNGSLNLTRQAEHIAAMYAAGVRVFLPAAGTSEFYSLSADEVVDVVRVTRDSAGADALVFAPIGMQLSHATEIAERSVEAGATGVMFMPFVHPYLSDAGARDYYLAVLERVPCPALIYRKAAIPSNALLLELAEHPHVVGIKYAENQLHEFRKVVLADGGRIEWLCGSAERFAPYFLLAGGTGYTTGAGNLCPQLTLAMHAAFAAGEFAEGMRLQRLILPIEDYRARDGDSYNVTMLKHALTLIGRDFGPPRPPMRQLTAAERTEIEALMRPILAAEAELAGELTSVGLAGR